MKLFLKSFLLIVLPLPILMLAYSFQLRASEGTNYGSSSVVIQGTVQDQGDALSGAIVKIAVNGGRGHGKIIGETITNEFGSFRIENNSPLASRPIKLIVIHPGYVRYVSQWIKQASLTSGKHLIKMQKGFALDGFVYDAKGNPAKDVSIVVRTPDDAGYRLHQWSEDSIAMPSIVKSDEKGYFEFKEHLSGTFNISARATDRAENKQQVDLRPGIAKTNTSLIIHLNDGPTVSGKVYMDGVPASDVALFWECDQGSSFWSPQFSTEDGSFILKNLKGQEKCGVVAHPANSHSSNYFWYFNKKMNKAKKGFIITRVRANVGDKGIELLINSEQPGSAIIRFNGKYPTYHGEFKIVPLSDPSGRTTVMKESLYSPKTMFILESMRPGKYLLISDLRDGKGAAAVEFEIEAQKQTEVIVIVEKGFIRGKAIGRVLDRITKQPIPFAKLSHTHLDTSTIGISIDSDGNFSRDFVGEELDLKISAAGYKKKTIKVDLTEDTNTDFGDVYLDRIN